MARWTVRNLETGEVTSGWELAKTPRSKWPRCGAWTRAGRPCGQLPVRHPDFPERPRNGRCRFHGGLSTGPRTPEGRRRVGDAARARYEAWAAAGFPDVWPPEPQGGAGASGA